ncbi:MAG TPA: hypothetical protein IAA36_01680 [Candidatus Eubacterium pullicola]|nr:hypothetical protein [Candidatus Eubacterium pullicola]
MSKKKKGTYIPFPFETTKSGRPKKPEAFSSIYYSMLISPAFTSLTASQKTLYMYCKVQYYGEEPVGKPTFSMNKGKWCKKYKLYSEGNAQGFYRDMEALINHGFIDCIYQGALYHRKNRYMFSNRWQQYGKKDYEVPYNVMTYAMYKRAMAANNK